MTKFTSSKWKKQLLIQAISYSELKEMKASSVDPDEAAHNEVLSGSLLFANLAVFIFGAI